MQAPNSPPVQCQASTHHEELLTKFSEYLIRDRGLRPSTRKLYARHVREFLRATCPTGATDFGWLNAPTILDFLMDHSGAGGGSVKIKHAAMALRGFLRYLAIHGECAPTLAGAVPISARWRLSSLPKVLGNDHVEALLGSFDLSTAAGLRDRAVALLIVRLGLRAGEVAGLALDDIDWRSGALRIVNGKSRRSSALPLMSEVGSAIAAYLEGGRPKTTERYLFVQHARARRAGAALTSDGVRRVIRRAWERSGVEVVSRGTHALRHTLATGMLASGVDLKGIADILGHRSLDTTYIYTKVDMARLSEVARPWLEVE